MTRPDPTPRSVSQTEEDGATRARRLARLVKQEARSAGFDLSGIASADAPSELGFFAEWVRRGHAGEMAYLTGQVERRSSLRAAFPWARSVVCVALQYDTPEPYSTDAPRDRGWISRYAWGDDYHEVMRKRLDALVARLQETLGPIEARAYVDTGPVVERAYAVAAGLGAWGKNTCLLNPEHGSWLFLGELVTNLDLVPDTPRTDMCGTCTACLDACPTGALPAPYELDARRCISYLTIEVRGAIPEPQREGLGRHVFGCDICQDVCPWNRKRRLCGGGEFAARPGLMAPALEELAGLDAKSFAARFRHSPVKRAKRRGFLRNVAVALGNLSQPSAREALEALAQDQDPVVREHAEWALARIR
jgi:epoxyqueuosine reductase